MIHSSIGFSQNRSCPMAKDAHFWHHPGWWFILLRKWHDPTFTDIYLGKYHGSSMDHFSNPKWWMIHLTCHLLYASVFVDTGRKQSSVRMMRLDMRWTSMPWHIKWGKRWALKGSIKVFFSIFTENDSSSYKYFEICKWQPDFGYHGCLILALSNSGC